MVAVEIAILIVSILTFACDAAILVVLLPGALNDYREWKDSHE